MTIKREPKTWDCYALYVESSDYEDCYFENKNQITLYGWKNIYYIKTDKEYIKPKKATRKSSYNGEIITEHFQRKYGFSLSEGNFFQLFYGAQETGWDEKVKERRKSWFLPWKMWKHRYHHLLNLDGTLFMDVTKLNGWEYKNEQPKNIYLFNDFDGEEIYATVTMEERMWTRGDGLFQWLKYFYNKKVSTDLDLEFSSEIGRRKGSWKGGTVGHGIELKPNETPTEAFKRYCNENELQYIGKLDDIEAQKWYQLMLNEKERRYQESKQRDTNVEVKGDLV